MKKRLKLREVHRGKRLNFDRVVMFFLIVLVLVAVFLVYYLFYDYDECFDEGCFFGALESCDKVTFVRVGEDVDWSYKVLGVSVGECDVDVELLRLKKGDLDLEVLDGESMVCDVLGFKNYPEEDISRCSGKLKEEMQEIVIQRMHDYLLENLGDLEEGFGVL